MADEPDQAREVLDQYQQRHSDLIRHVRELEAKRAKLLPTGQTLEPIDTELTQAKREIGELERFFRRHPDA